MLTAQAVSMELYDFLLQNIGIPSTREEQIPAPQ